MCYLFKLQNHLVTHVAPSLLVKLLLSETPLFVNEHTRSHLHAGFGNACQHFIRLLTVCFVTTLAKTFFAVKR